MFFDDARPHSPDYDSPESGIRFAMMLAELWHDWFEAMSEVAYHTHRACEFLAENGGRSGGRHSPFDSRHWSGPSEMPNGSVDMDKLKDCLQSMDPMEAARIMHAVQMMQAMDSMLKRRKSRSDEEEGGAW
jgi:hypothetical protein